MTYEDMGRRTPRHDVQRDVKDGGVPKQRDIYLGLRQRHSAERLRERLHVPSQEGLHTLTSIKERMEGGLYSDFGWEKVRINPDLSVIQSDGTVLAVGLEIETKDGTEQTGWVTVEFFADRTAVYRTDIHDEILDTVTIPEDFEMAWLQQASESRKVVKSRPSWMYPELFNLPAEEVWPAHADIAVIGDPFQACDKERTTIVEYEYADEMVPPYLRIMLEGGHGEFSTISSWLYSVYHEDTDVVGRMYGMYTPGYSGNPYAAFMGRCFEFCKNIEDNLVNNEEISEEQSWEIAKLKLFASRLIDGTWTMDEGAELIDLEGQRIQNAQAFQDQYSSPEKYLRDFFNYKQTVIEQLGDPEAWEKFEEKWKKYLSALPVELLKKNVPNIEQQIAQVQYWLRELPSSTSPDRVQKGMSFLEDFFGNLFQYYDEGNPETAILHDSDVNFILERDSHGAFGFFVPGYPVNLRTKKIIQEGISRIEQAKSYITDLLPHLRQEQERLREMGVPFTPETQLQYLKTLEKSWARQHFFVKRTQKSVPVHGFFPYKMQEIEPQDRILALTSVTMHGFNTLNESGFRKDLEASLPYLKIGGKYILGPINQYVYFGSSESSFDAEGLTRALKYLADNGQIRYEFKKGVREYADSDSYNDAEKSWDKDVSVLHENESAHSLVITRLK